MEGPPAGSGLKIKPNQKSVKGRLSRGQGVGEEGREGCGGGGEEGREGGVCVSVCVWWGRAGGGDGRTATNRVRSRRKHHPP